MFIRRAFCTCSKIVSPSVTSTINSNTFSGERFERRQINVNIKPPPSPEQEDDDGSDVTIKSDGFKDDTALNLINLLGCKVWRANDLVRSFPQFHEISLDVLQQRVSYLEEKNVKKSRLAKMSWLLLLDSEDLLEQAAYVEKILALDFNCAVCFVRQIEEHWLNRIMHLWRAERAAEPEFIRPGTMYRNRVDYMADRLKIKPTAVADMMVSRPTVATLPFNKIRFILDLLIEDAAIPKVDICTDPFLFMKNIPLMKGRIMIAKKQNITPISTKLLLTTDDCFNDAVVQQGNSQVS